MAPLARRICLIGPESTGKSELAERTRRELGATVVPEFARAYALRVDRELTVDDVEPIARGEIEALDGVIPSVVEGSGRAGHATVGRPTHPDPSTDARDDRVLVILDTDLISTVVYARHYYGSCPRWIEDEVRARRADLYLLLDTDVAWKPDRARDAGGDAREDLFDAFRAALDEFETNWRIVSGTWEERWEAVKRYAAS